MKKVEGGVTAAEGFQAASTAAGIKYKDRTDMAMIYSTEPCVVAGTFTTNVVKAAPVKWDQEVVYHSPAAQAVIINSGIANACTGEEGYGWRSVASCTAPRGTYCAERDILFYDDRPDTFLTLRPGGMAVFFPSDAHAPLIGSGEVRKCIVKVRC